MGLDSVWLVMALGSVSAMESGLEWRKKLISELGTKSRSMVETTYCSILVVESDSEVVVESDLELPRKPVS